MSFDVAIAGGGPVGLAAALALCRAGLSVAVVERRRPPLDKACGEGLMPDGLAALAALGVDPAALGGAPLAGISWLEGARRADGAFPAGCRGLGVRRPRLHAALAEAAAAAGAELRFGVAAAGLTADGLATSAGPLAARWVVGADGLHSAVRVWAGLARPPLPRRRFGVRRHVRIPPWGDRVEVHWGEGCEGYVTPVGPALVGVALLWNGAWRGSRLAGGFERLLPRLPALAARLREAPVAGPDRGAGPFGQRARAVARGRVLLVGDAAGYLDPLTGEGLALGFAQARALATALAAGDPARYRAAHRRDGRRARAITRLALFASAHPAVRRRAVAALAADPALFTRLLGLLTGDLPLAALGLRPLLAFTRRLALP
ncbi:MAG: NAD(P)/FAD-dependent oxidoreductase [Thermoanaerobaculia bacterium]|nr:NAD(P)/FAD-dependent oxidoreductase [Thermoanaerobaculia bacterium]